MVTTEADGTSGVTFPQEARLRNLTYCAPLYLDMSSKVFTAPGADDPVEAEWQPALDDDGNEIEETPSEIFIGKVPMMVKSNRCSLFSLEEKNFYELGECPYDSGGYFIVKGSEKVLIAQERMAFNQVYVFKKQSPFTFYSTVTSHLEKSGRISEMEVRMYPRSAAGTVSLPSCSPSRS